jgi:hypothetical protein
MHTTGRYLFSLLILAALSGAAAVAQEQYGKVIIHQPGGTQIVITSAQNGDVINSVIVRDGGAVSFQRKLSDPPWNYTATVAQSETLYAAWGGDMGPATNGKRICCWWEQGTVGRLSFIRANCEGTETACQSETFSCNRIWDACPIGTTDKGPALDLYLN